MLTKIFYFPYVLLHEGSHILMSILLNVKIEKIVLFPENGESPYVSVENLEKNFLKSCLIGLAPTIFLTPIAVILMCFMYNNTLITILFLYVTMAIFPSVTDIKSIFIN